ncbi:MAG: hypothetical protein U9N86_08180 [Bacteroidota bacterium]|nr:hypothetical protein [Bacteroidota bacterium]
MEPKIPKYGPLLTWNDLIELFLCKEKFLQMDSLYSWAVNNSDMFYVDDNAGLHLIIKEEDIAT